MIMTSVAQGTCGVGHTSSAATTKPQADTIVEGLEVVINHILHARGLYPKQMFKKRRIYNTLVYQSVYPPLNEYIRQCLLAARDLLLHSQLEKFFVAIYLGEDNDIIEYYEFRFKNWNATGSDTDHGPPDSFLMRFEQQLRTSLYKQSERMNDLPKLPKDAKFKLLCQTPESGSVRLQQTPQLQEFPWLESSVEKNNQSERFEKQLMPFTNITSIGVEMKCYLWIPRSDG